MEVYPPRMTTNKIMTTITALFGFFHTTLINIPAAGYVFHLSSPQHTKLITRFMVQKQCEMSVLPNRQGEMSIVITKIKVIA